MRIALACLLLAGCTGMNPYAEVGAGETIERYSDWFFRGENGWVCDSAKAEIALGVDGGLRGDNWLARHSRGDIQLYHWSQYACGGINDKPELYEMRYRALWRVYMREVR